MFCIPDSWRVAEHGLNFDVTTGDKIRVVVNLRSGFDIDSSDNYLLKQKEKIGEIRWVTSDEYDGWLSKLGDDVKPPTTEVDGF